MASLSAETLTRVGFVNRGGKSVGFYPPEENGVKAKVGENHLYLLQMHNPGGGFQDVTVLTAPNPGNASKRIAHSAKFSQVAWSTAIRKPLEAENTRNHNGASLLSQGRGVLETFVQPAPLGMGPGGNFGSASIDRLWSAC